MKKIQKWAYGLVGGCIGGGATTATAWLGMVGAKVAGADVPSLNFEALGIIFLSGVISSGLAYLKQSPLPPLSNGDTQPPFKTEQ
jgi:hypothetical protein